MEKVEFENLLNNGENSSVEFKNKRTRAESIAKEMVAMLNLEGGCIYIGIEDNKEMTGVERDKNYEEWIMNISRNAISPSVIPMYEEFIIDDIKIIKIEVKKGINKPYYTTNNGKYYIRVGSTSREASQQGLIRLLQESGQIHYEIIPIINTGIKNLSRPKVEEYFEIRNIDVSDYDEKELQNILYNTEILVDYAGDKRAVSLLGGLFFLKNVDLFIKNSGVQIAVFDGNDVTQRIIDKKDLKGNIPDIIEKTLDYINLNTKVSETFEGIKRIDIPEYRIKIIREIIVNAFSHRDWSLTGAKIRVYMFEDFLEVRSPGKIPNTLNIERMKMGVSYYRNPVISQMLTDYGYADKIGRGIMNIISYCKNKNLRAPDFEENGFEFTVRLYKHKQSLAWYNVVAK